MTFSITGLNHRTAPVEIRERLAFDSISIPGALRALKQCPGVQEGLILSTCNRVEIAVASEQLDASAVGEFLAGERAAMECVANGVEEIIRLRWLQLRSLIPGRSTERLSRP